MKSNFCIALVCAGMVTGGAFYAMPTSGGAPQASAATVSTASAAAKRPAKIARITAHPGPGVGQVTFTWSHDGKYTTAYKLETALSLFSKTNKSMPRHGRHHVTFTISPKARSFTMSATQAAHAGSKIGSGNHLFFRFAAVNTAGRGTAVRDYPYLQAVMPKAAAPKSNGLKITLGSFNVRSAKAGGSRKWMARRGDVAREIARANPQVVAIQELGPGRADGKAGSTTGTIRQTDSLKASLKSIGAGRYKRVRSTPYVEPGKKSGSQGARILFDSNRLTQLSLCTETTGNRNYSSSCSIKLPLLKGDSENLRRRAAYAKFRNKSTGKQFYVVSAHLDSRHSKGTAREKKYNALRGSQVRTVVSALDKINRGHLPVVFAGDVNSWQNIRIGNAPHDILSGLGFYDTAAAVNTANLKYSTYNNFETTQRAASQGFASRLDLIMVKGATGASSFTNVTKVPDSSRPSDHNLIVATTVI